MFMNLIWEPVVLTASLACSEQPHHSACLTVRPAHRCSVSDRACASCVIPKTCGCYSSAVNEVVRFIKVNKVQFSKLPGTQLFLVPQTVQLNCPCSTSSSPAGRLWARPEVSVQSAGREVAAGPLSPTPPSVSCRPSLELALGGLQQL